jgi:hypothetical protein
MILCVGTVNAPEKGLIKRRLRYLLFLIVLASAIAEFTKYLQSHGLIK